jgi:hypothetical protein
MNKLTKIRRVNGSYHLNGLWGCKRTCDANHLFNKTKREACKAKCEEINYNEATSLYELDPQTSDTFTTSVTPYQQPGMIAGMDQNTLLLLGGGGLLLFLATKKKKNKRR